MYAQDHSISVVTRCQRQLIKNGSKWRKKFANVGATTVHHSISAATRCQRQLIKKQHMINRHVSKMDKEICKCGGNYGPPFDQCRDTL